MRPISAKHHFSVGFKDIIFYLKRWIIEGDPIPGPEGPICGNHDMGRAEIIELALLKFLDICNEG